MRMDHYQTLGVAKTATQEEIKAAYRKMAAKHHPDREGGDTATFQKIQAAYDVIGDEQKRQEYDNPYSGHHGGFGGSGGGFSFNVNGMNVNLNDLFGGGFQSPFADIFRHQHQQRKPSYRTRVQVTLEQAAVGAELPIHINTVQSPNNGVFKINIPQGIDNGQAVRYDNLIPGAELIVEFFVIPHPKFRRDGLDISTIHKINALELLIGKVIDVETIWGTTLQVTIPPCTQATSKLRLHNKGMIHNGQQGHHYVLIDIQIPDTISTELKKAIEVELLNQ